MYHDDPLATPEYWKASKTARKLYHKLRAKQAKRASDGLRRVYQGMNAKKERLENESRKAKGNAMRMFRGDIMGNIRHSLTRNFDDHVTIVFGLADDRPMHIHGVEKDVDMQWVCISAEPDPTLPAYVDPRDYAQRDELLVCGSYEHFVLTGWKQAANQLTIWGFIEIPSYRTGKRQIAESLIPKERFGKQCRVRR